MIVRLLADGTLIGILLVAAPVILLSLVRRGWIAVPIVIMAGLTSLLVGKVMSLLYQPSVARPFVELGVKPGAAYIDNPGFPSDHALLATVTVIAVYTLSRNRRLTILLAGLLGVMCVARVAALVHTPIDIIGGLIAGLSGSIWYKKLTK